MNPKTDDLELRAQIINCLRGARAEGYTGTDADFTLTEWDEESICSALGRTPTRQEWRDARRGQYEPAG
jgi:hypothetical protein